MNYFKIKPKLKGRYSQKLDKAILYHRKQKAGSRKQEVEPTCQRTKQTITVYQTTRQPTRPKEMRQRLIISADAQPRPTRSRRPDPWNSTDQHRPRAPTGRREHSIRQGPLVGVAVVISVAAVVEENRLGQTPDRPVRRG